MFEFWKFAFYGAYLQSTEFTDKDTGEIRQYMSFIYKGGQHSIPFDDDPEKFKALSSLLKRGQFTRLIGDLWIKTGLPRIAVTNYEIDGLDEKFKPLTDRESEVGSFFRGTGEIIEKKSFRRKIDNVDMYQVHVRAPGGITILNLPDAKSFVSLPNTGNYVWSGRLDSEAQRNYSPTTGSSVRALLSFRLMSFEPVETAKVQKRESTNVG